MSGPRAERVVVVSMRLLAVAFAVAGILFVSAPEAVIETIGEIGDRVGDFAPGAGSDQKLWLGLAFAYMVVITGLALCVQADVVRYRPLLLLLAAGKAASSLAAGAFFVLDEDVFVYLVNFVVDGGLVAVALGCWTLAGRVASAPVSQARASVAVPGGDGGVGAPAGDGREPAAEGTTPPG